MGVTTKKYGVSVSFCLKLAIFGKTVGYHRLQRARGDHGNLKWNHIPTESLANPR
jgi:hypothetical protein